MSLRLLIRQRSAAGGADKATEVVLDNEIIVLGRDPGCEVVLAEQAVSRKHARLLKEGNLYFVEDLGSAFGTQVNERRLPKGEKRVLANGDVIAIAQFDVTFERLLGNGGKDNPGTVAVARKAVKDVMRSLSSNGDVPYFRVMNGAQEGQRIELPEAREWVVGRDDSADIVLRDELVSRRHVRIRRDWSGTHVEDLGSRNGIRINGNKSDVKTLKDRDELEIGNVRLLYLDPSEANEGPAARADDDGEKTNFNPVAEASPAAEPDEGDRVPEAAATDAENGMTEEAPPAPPLPFPDAAPPPPVPRLEPQSLLLLGFMGLVALGILAVVVAILVGA